MRPHHERNSARAMVAQGLSDTEIARRLGVPRSTVRTWRRPTYERVRRTGRCPRCWRVMTPLQFDAAHYAELLGLYLGDGHITQLARTQRLRISLDASLPAIVDETASLLGRCFPGNRVARVVADAGSTAVLRVYHGHLGCLFPQHGMGKKHERHIALEPWQEALVAAAPWAFLRGCIRSDGCVFVNRTGKYSYLSYDFCNESADIRDLFARICTSVGVTRRPAGNRVRIYRRASVELLAEHVGGKA